MLIAYHYWIANGINSHPADTFKMMPGQFWFLDGS